MVMITSHALIKENFAVVSYKAVEKLVMEGILSILRILSFFEKKMK